MTLADVEAKWVSKAILATDHEIKIVTASKSYPFLIRRIDYAGEMTNAWWITGEAHNDNTDLLKELLKAKSFTVNFQGQKTILPITKEFKEWAVACQK